MGNINEKENKIENKIENINLIEEYVDELLYNFNGYLYIDKKYIDYVEILFYEDYLIIKAINTTYSERISYYHITNWKTYCANKKNSQKLSKSKISQHQNYWEFDRINNKNKIYKFLINIDPKKITSKLLTIIHTHMDYINLK